MERQLGGRLQGREGALAGEARRGSDGPSTAERAQAGGAAASRVHTISTMKPLGSVIGAVGVLTASWEPEPGSLLGFENFKPNIQRMKESIRAQKQQQKQSKS